jgi:hypothetical protein
MTSSGRLFVPFSFNFCSPQLNINGLWAVSTAYLHGRLAESESESETEQGEQFPSLGAPLHGLPAAAVSVEMSPPQPSIARSLRLSPGQPVIIVTTRFDDTGTSEPTGLTVVMLKPELFRVAIDTTEAPVAAS